MLYASEYQGNLEFRKKLSNVLSCWCSTCSEKYTGPDGTLGSTLRSDKEGLRKRCKTNKQKRSNTQTSYYLIWKQNRGVACSCTLFKLHLGLWCNFVLVHTAHFRLWTVGFSYWWFCSLWGSWGYCARVCLLRDIYSVQRGGDRSCC